MIAHEASEPGGRSAASRAPSAGGPRIVGGLLLAAGLLVAGLLALGWSTRRTPVPADSVVAPRAPHASALGARMTQEALPTSTGATAARSDADLDEPELMATLRSLGNAEPVRTLALTAQGNRRYADSPDAPERAWFAVKALVNLGRFHEARDAARVMVAKYPGNRWALDVERHLLVHPLDYPSREELQQRMADEAE